jgi:hypothetical protein
VVPSVKSKSLPSLILIGVFPNTSSSKLYFTSSPSLEIAYKSAALRLSKSIVVVELLIVLVSHRAYTFASPVTRPTGWFHPLNTLYYEPPTTFARVIKF